MHTWRMRRKAVCTPSAFTLTSRCSRSGRSCSTIALSSDRILHPAPRSDHSSPNISSQAPGGTPPPTADPAIRHKLPAGQGVREHGGL